MTLPLFLYGTWRDDEALAAAIGRPARPGERLAATAPGFVVLGRPDGTSPALVRRPGGSAVGDVLLELSPFERDVLDTLAGTQRRRGIVPVMIGEELHEAESYLPAVDVTGFVPWSFETWRTVHKDATLPRDAMQAEAIRRKLLAIRPN